MRAFVPETTWADDLLVSLDRGDINQCSFEFYCDRDSFSKQDGQVVRTVESCDVVALSVVAVPAYPSTTSVHARDMAKALEEATEPEGEPVEVEDSQDDAGRGFRTPVHITA
jgi:phage head maturation protease